jgi:acetyltransferase-like isoleucine patch superfamily enzyme
MNNILFFYGGNTCLEIISYLEDMQLLNYKDSFHIIDTNPNIKRFAKIKQKKIFYKKIQNLKTNNFKGIYITSGFPNLREKAFIELKKKKLKPSILIHPKSHIGRHCSIGKGTIIAPFSLISPHSKIGNNCFINTFASIGHHCHIGNSNVFCPYSVTGGNCRVGNNNFFGTGAILNPNTSVGNLNKISANSVLRTKLKNKFIAHGNPAKIGRIF